MGHGIKACMACIVCMMSINNMYAVLGVDVEKQAAKESVAAAVEKTVSTLAGSIRQNLVDVVIPLSRDVMKTGLEKSGVTLEMLIQSNAKARKKFIQFNKLLNAINRFLREIGAGDNLQEKTLQQRLEDPLAVVIPGAGSVEGMVDAYTKKVVPYLAKRIEQAIVAKSSDIAESAVEEVFKGIENFDSITFSEIQERVEQEAIQPIREALKRFFTQLVDTQKQAETYIKNVVP